MIGQDRDLADAKRRREEKEAELGARFIRCVESDVSRVDAMERLCIGKQKVKKLEKIHGVKLRRTK